MNSLYELQRGFMQAIYNREETGFASQLISGELNGEYRLAIYRNNTFANLNSAMQSAYPVIMRLVGEEFFTYTISEYIYCAPSQSGDLHAYGATFADFLTTFPPVSRLAYLPDVARLEWACHTAFFAADHPPLDRIRLAEVPPDRYSDLSLRLHPACRLLESQFPIDTIWQVNQENYRADQAVDLTSGGVKLLVRRPHHHAEVVSLNEGEWHFLNSLAAGRPLANSSIEAVNSSDEFDLGMALQRFVLDSTLVDFTLS